MCHVEKKKPRRYFRRRFGNGEAEACEFDGGTETYEFGVGYHVLSTRMNSLASHFFRFKQKAECHVQREGKKVLLETSVLETMAKTRDLRIQVSHNFLSSEEEFSTRFERFTTTGRYFQSRNKAMFQPASGNRCEVWRHTWIGQRWSFATCRSQTINTMGRVFQNMQKKLGTTRNLSKFGIEAIKTNALDV